MAVSDRNRIAKITPTIETTGTAAQAGPRRRDVHGHLGGVRGAATTPAWRSSSPASDEMNPSATDAKRRRRGPGPSVAVQPSLEFLELSAELAGKAIAEPGVVLMHLG